MSITFTMYAPNGASNEQFTCRSGNNYSSDAYGFVKSVVAGDVNDLEGSGCLSLGMSQARSNLAATTDPTPSNDNTQDYGAGSVWLNTSNSNVWNCLSAATGAAAWNLCSQNTIDFRNLLDGGDFTTNPWQRGTTFTGLTNSVSYTADRWFVDAANSANSISVSQQSPSGSGFPAGFTNALQWGRASSNTDTHAIYLGQVLESADCIRTQGQQVTLSFWAKAGANFSAASSALTVQLNHSTTAGNDTAAHLVAASTNWQSPPTIINTTATLTTSWVRYQFTGTVPATATQLGLLFSYVTVGTAGANDWVQFAGIQLEQGGSATPFEHRDVAVETEICQRYCYVVGGTTGAIGSGAATSSTAAGFYIPFPVQMYTAPAAISLATAADLSVYTYANASVGALSAAAFGSASVNGIHVTATSTGMTSAVPYVLYVGTAKTGNLVISCDF